MLVEKHPVLFYSMVVICFILSFIVAIVPLPFKFSFLRPELICLFLIYWVVSVPQHLGLTFAFVIGFIQDLIEHTVWGAHALALALVAYICINAYQRIVSYSIWHQTLWVAVLVGVHQVVVNWVQSLNAYHAPLSTIAASIVVTTLLWPVLVIVMRLVRRRFDLN